MRAALLFGFCLLTIGCIGSPTDPTPETNGTTSTPTPSTTELCAIATPGGASQTSGVQVSNQPGAFSYQGSVAASNGKNSWKWENPSIGARASWQGSTATGSFKLTILESCGAQVLQESFAPASQQATKTTEKGKPGAWLITIETTAFTGSVQLSVTSE